MKFSPEEAYNRWHRLTDPEHVSVKEDIARGARISNGLTDIHDHLPRLLTLSSGNVLEIGTRFGASTAALLYGVDRKGGHLWSVDVEDCSGLFENDRWTFIKGSSLDVAYVKSVIPDQLDLVFIDGDHSYEGVKADLANYGPMGKVIALHDAQRWGHEGVLPAIFEYIGDTKCRHKEMHIYTDSNGLAVLT
jgi:cephalosporin hydroxylase